jgi:hypothetical protein
VIIFYEVDMGSSILFSESPSPIKDRIPGGIDALLELEHVDLDQLVTLDFEINPEALAKLIEIQPFVDETEIQDLEQIVSFTRKHGLNHLYELATY